MIRRVVGWLSPKMRLVGAENLPEGACVIVGNHSQMYGPLAAEFCFPFARKIWCAGEMQHRTEAADYAFRDFWSGKPKTVRWLYRMFSYLIAPLSELIFTHSHTIGVYHDARLIATFRESVAALEDGCKLVIFPECYEERNNIVHAFQQKFVDVARFYAKKSSQPLSFVPAYIAPRLKTVYFGKPIPFWPDAPIEAERQRICDALADAITELAVSLPPHTVVPYPNIPKKQYPKNLPLEVYDEKTTC